MQKEGEDKMTGCDDRIEANIRRIVREEIEKHDAELLDKVKKMMIREVGRVYVVDDGR